MLFVVRKIVQVELVGPEDQDAVVVSVVERLSINAVAIAILVTALHGNLRASFAADRENVELAEVVDSVGFGVSDECFQTSDLSQHLAGIDPLAVQVTEHEDSVRVGRAASVPCRGDS